MGVDGSKQACANAMYVVLLEGDVIGGTGVAEFFGEAKIDDIDEMGGFARAHYEICGLDVAVYKIF